MANLRRQLNSLRLTTAEILYYMPDHPSLLQSYIWQDYDRAPQFPVLKDFLDFWTRELDGTLHSVNLASMDVITEGDLASYDGDFKLS